MIAEQSTGFPGYDSIIGLDNATIGNILKDHGYATSWIGKNHNTPTYAISTSGPFDQWPSGMGFDYFYGFMGGETDQWTPWLFRDHTQIFPWNDNPNYNMITGMADDAINYLREVDAAAPDKPFFMYYVPGATHAPHQPTQEWIDKFKGKFDMGWNAMRDEIFANQKRLGVIPENTQLTPWPDDLPKWDTLDADSKKMFARQAEVFAAYVAYADNEIGRVIDEVRRQGKLDNTLIIYIEGDNGTSAEGSTIGTAFDLAAIQAHQHAGRGPAEVLRRLGRADDPAAHVGGLVLGLRHAVQVDQADRLALRRHAAGHGDVLARPHHRRGRRAQPVPPRDRHRADDPRGHRHRGAADGERHRRRSRSRASAWPTPGRRGPQDVPSRRTTQYFEMFGDRAIYHDGWIASTTPPAGPWLMGLGKLPDVIDGYNWELYDLSKDFSQADDLAAKEPDKLQGPAAALPGRGSEVPGAAARQLGRRAAAGAAAERDRRPGRVRLYRRALRPAGRLGARPAHPVLHHHRRGRGARRAAARACSPRSAAASAATASTCSKGKPVFTYNLLALERFRWAGDAGADARASTASSSTSPMTDPAPARAAPAC